jgi:protein phosphatase
VKALVVSDIHGNIEALRAVEAAEPDADQVLCLGDLVDYGPRPDATVAWVRENATTTVRGNHDNAVAFDVDCGSAPLFQCLPATRVAEWREAVAGIEADLVLVGHTHIPVI